MGQVLTADGCIDSSTIQLFTSDGCCPPSVCNMNLCAMFCIFANLLPNGPMWDAAKMQVIASDDCHGSNLSCGDCLQTECATLIDYAKHAAHMLYDLVQTALWPALRESGEETAVTTQASWLDRYGWRNCWESSCRDYRLGLNAPYECGDACPTYVIPNIPPALECAVNRGVILALRRLNMQPIPSLCGINWVIEPLGAMLRPYRPDCMVGDQLLPAADLYCCEGARFEICPTSQKISACPDIICEPSHNDVLIDNSFMNSKTCDGVTTVERVYPGVLAAQCLALSMLPADVCETTVPIIRCIDPVAIQ